MITAKDLHLAMHAFASTGSQVAMRITNRLRGYEHMPVDAYGISAAGNAHLDRQELLGELGRMCIVLQGIAVMVDELDTAAARAAFDTDTDTLEPS